MERTRNFVILGFLIAMFILPQAGICADPIKFGMPNAVSGHGAPYAVPMIHGAKVAVEEINNSGGVLGRPFELLIRDHAA